MKSIYEDEEFAQFWDLKVGDGEVYKDLILDPVMLEMAGDIAGKTVIDLGCGNGYLGKKLETGRPKKIIMLDISKHNLRNAAKRCTGGGYVFLEQDIEQDWQIADESIDVIYSNFVLNEIADLNRPYGEAFRVLRQGGKLIFSSTHPAWDLFVFAQEQIGIKSEKLLGLGNYFHRGMARFIMRGDNKSHPLYNTQFEEKRYQVEHYQRPMSDYLNGLIEAGFTIQKFLEPRVSPELLKACPKFSNRMDFPASLILYSTK